MTNDEFLNLLFANKPPNAHIFTAAHPGDPATGNYRFNPFVGDPTNNNYFCVSSLTNTDRRTPQNFAALHCLVVDDVGTKLTPEAVVEKLGYPTYTIETSAGNLQLGYVFKEPLTDRAQAEGLVKALCDTFGSDMAGTNRLARLPQGTNGKPGKNYRTQFIEWSSVLHPPEDLILKLGAVPIPPVDENRKPFLPPDRDPVLARLPHYETAAPGTYRITCPWVHEHTGGRDDGTAYIAPAGFKCYHGHCAGKTFADLREYLGLTASEMDDAIVEAALGVGSVGGATGVSESAPASTDPHPWLDQTVRDLFHDDGTVLTKEERNKLYPRYWIFDELIPAGTPWAIAGEGGLGKSRLAMALCMSVATGIPLGDHFTPDPYPHPVLFLTQEDDRADRAHRFCTQYERLCERDRRWRADTVAHRLIDNLYIPSLPFGQQLDQRFLESVESFARVRGALRLVLFDPLTLFWDHSNPQLSINTAAGVVSTFKRLIQVARVHADGNLWSAGIMHHMNKAGEQFYGSVMIANHVRTLFNMTETDPAPDDKARYATLECVKTNSTNKKGHKFYFELDSETAAVYPRDAFAFETDEQKMAAMVRNSPDGISQSELKTRATKAGIEDSAAIMGRWRGQPEKMRELGIKLGRYNRFESDNTGLGGEE